MTEEMFGNDPTLKVMNTAMRKVISKGFLSGY
jgi:hypothetical protein